MKKVITAVILSFSVLMFPGSKIMATEAKIGGEAPFFFINTYNPESCGSKRIFLDHLVGQQAKNPQKLVLLTFFNIDCKPCRKELPFLQKLSERYREKGFFVLAVNCDHQKNKIEELKSYIKEAGFTFPIIKDRFQALRRRYGVESYPTMFMIDSHGKILDIRVGYDPVKKPFPLEWVKRQIGVDAGSNANEKLNSSLTEE